MTTRAAGLRRQHITWLGLCVVPLLGIGGYVGLRVATTLGVAAWIGQVCGFVAGYLVSRTILRQYFVRRL